MCLFAEEARLRAEQEERERLERERKEKELAELEKKVKFAFKAFNACDPLKVSGQQSNHFIQLLQWEKRLIVFALSVHVLSTWSAERTN